METKIKNVGEIVGFPLEETVDLYIKTPGYFG
jgi:hypothetical protein